MTTNLKDKVALVTGGSRGIGAAIVERLAAEGAAVAFTYSSSPDRAQGVVAAIEIQGGKALAIKADAADADAVRAAVNETVRQLGRLDILVNNAGTAINGPVDDYKLEDFDKTYAINVRGLFVAIQQSLKHMQAGARVINIGSVVSDHMPFPNTSAYAMSKGAVAGLTRGLARELGNRGITINNIQPGPIDTELNPADGPAGDAMRASLVLNRYGKPSDIAAMVALLAGPDGSFITGTGLVIDGGFDV